MLLMLWMVCLLSTLPNQHRHMIQNVAEIDLAEKEKKVAFSKNEHRKGVLK